MRINNNNTNFKGISALAKPLGQFYNSNAVIPTLIIESGVTAGRSYEANKRGGKKEATERLVEQGISALVWVYGVKILQKTGEFLGKKIFKNASAFKEGANSNNELASRIKNFDFDINKEVIKRNNINPKIANFKCANMVAATAIATVFIGFILPKINHKISSKINKKNEEKNNVSALKPVSFEDYKKQISFKGNAINSFANILENNSTARLFITDLGVVSGRFKNGRNKYERIEGLFRDIASIYFYLGATNNIVGLLNKLTSTVNIDPKVAEAELEALREQIQNKGNVEEFLSKIKDNSNFTKKALSLATNGKSDDSLKYVSKKQTETILKSVEDFSNLILSKIKGKNLNDSELISQIEKIAKRNINKNFGFYALGTAISMFVLGIVIPKIQYFITKKLTHSDTFHDEVENKK